MEEAMERMQIQSGEECCDKLSPGQGMAVALINSRVKATCSRAVQDQAT